MTDAQDIATTERVASTAKRGYVGPQSRSKNRTPRKIKLKPRPKGKPRGY